MSRGVLYEFKQNLNSVGTAKISDFDGYIDHEFDYLLEEDPAKYIEDFLKELKQYEIPTGAVVSESTETVIPFFEITEEGKKNFFRERLSCLKERISTLSLEEFITTHVAWTFCGFIDDPFAEAVTTDDTDFQTLDRFMRTASGRYYIGKVFFMK
mgnify:FL=1